MKSKKPLTKKPMATPRDKFMELRKSGVDAQTARKQAYGDITPVSPVANAPVAWVPPAVTPIQPAPTQPPINQNQAVLEANQAKVQAEIQAGTRPQVGQQPVAQPPIQQAPIQEVAQPTVEVQKTVETPTVKAEKTAEVQPIQQPLTIGDMYNNIVNKIDVPPEQKALSTYKIAQNRYNKANMFSSMTPAELSSQMRDAKIVEWSPAWEDLKTMNPWLVQSVKGLNAVNGVNPTIFTTINNPDGTKVKKNNLVDSFVSDYEDNYGDIVQLLRDIYNPDTAEEARNAIYTPEVKQAEEKATAIELQMNALDDTISKIDKDIDKEYEGTWATGSRVALEKQFRKETLTNQYNSLLKNYTTYANKANNLISQNTDLYKSAQERQGKLNEAIAWVAMTEYQNQLARANEKPQFQQYGDKVYQVVDGQLQDTGISTSSNSWQSANITRYNPSTGANESTPIFYRKKDDGKGFEAVDLAGNPIDANLLGGGTTWTPTGWYATGTTEMRTDRNNNPTAFTVDIAKQAWLVEGVDYVVWDKFPWSSNLYTAKLIWDPIETSIRVIDKIGFTTKSGQNRWVYTDKLGLNNETWAKMSPTEKATAVKKMYQQEWGNGTAIWEASISAVSKFAPDEVKAFTAYNGSTIPEQYKTPQEKKEFINRYNAWRTENWSATIKTGAELLNVQLSDKATEWEKSALRYGARMLNAVNDLKDVEKGFLALPLKDQLYETYAPNLLKSDNQKILEARKKDFITAVLRKESWAAISPSEFAWEEIKYFPKPWDSPSVIAAKQNARNFAVKSLLSDIGRDLNGNMVSSLYLPEAVVVENPSETTWETASQRIARLRNKK